MRVEETSTRRRRRAWWPVAVPLLVVGVALVVRAIGLDQEPVHDELFHYLAARGLTERGDYTIVPGGQPYLRGWQTTWLTARVMDVFGASLTASRVPSAILGSLLALLWGGWLVRRGHILAGLLAGLLVALDPTLVQLSQIVRFYPMQILAFAAGALCLFEAIEPERTVPARLLLGAGGLAFGALAVDLQVVSVIGAAGVLLYLGAAGIVRARTRPRVRRRWLVLGFGAGALALLVALVVIDTALLRRLVSFGTYADLWAENRADNVRFYYAHLHDLYAPLVAFLPLFALLALLADARAAALLLFVFGLALGVHSMLAWKDMRYVAYALPFFFVLSSLGVAEGGRRLWAWLRRLDVPFRFGRIPAALALALIGGSLLVANRAFLVTGRLLTRPPESSFPLQAQGAAPLSWSSAQARLEDLSESHEVVVSTDPLKPLFYIGRLDYALSRTNLHTRGGWLPEFTEYEYLSVPIISTAASLRTVRGCHSSGIVIVEGLVFQKSSIVLPEVRRMLLVDFEHVNLPVTWGLEVFRWSDGGEGGMTECHARDSVGESGP